MSPDDPRHGSTRGYRAGCHDDCCRPANTRYDKMRRLDVQRGRPRMVPAVGTKRRIQALHCLGWSLRDIAKRAGYGSYQAVHQATTREKVTITTAARIAAVYAELCMVVGPSDVTRRRAERMGYAPPLAWDDIDNDPEPVDKYLHVIEKEIPKDVDPVVVLRILQGDGTPATTASAAERRAVVQRWSSSGRSLADLARLTGWKPERYGVSA